MLKGSENEWVMTPHARQRAAGRGLNESDVLAVAAYPQLVRDDLKGDPDVRMMVGRGVLVVANVVDRVVITCGPADGDDAAWQVDAARVAALDADDSDRPSSTYAGMPTARGRARASSTRTGRPAASSVQVRHVLGDDVHPAIRARVAKLVDGDWSRVRVLSPTRVEIDER